MNKLFFLILNFVCLNLYAGDSLEFIEVKVRPGDTLQKISSKLYGTTKKWLQIYSLNKDVISNRDIITVGAVLKVRKTNIVHNLANESSLIKRKPVINKIISKEHAQSKFEVYSSLQEKTNTTINSNNESESNAKIELHKIFPDQKTEENIHITDSKNLKKSERTNESFVVNDVISPYREMEIQ